MFSYIEMLRDAGPQRWVFNELAAVAEQRFRFAEDEEASEYVSRLAASLPLYAPEHALNGSYLHEEWRPELVSIAYGNQNGKAAGIGGLLVLQSFSMPCTEYLPCKKRSKEIFGSMVGAGLQPLPGCLSALSLKRPCAMSEGSILSAKSCAAGTTAFINALSAADSPYEWQGACSPLDCCILHGVKPVCHVQVTEVLECMTPQNCRLDLQSCAFEALRKEQKLLSASDVSVSTEPWCAH